MNRRQSARLDRKKFFADPVMLGAIFVLIVFLSLFILYPLAMLMIDSVYVRDTKLLGAQSLLSGEKIVYYLADGSWHDNETLSECEALTAYRSAQYAQIFDPKKRIPQWYLP